MIICLLGLRFTGTITLLYCIRISMEKMYIVLDWRFVIHCVVLGIAYLLLSNIGESYPVFGFILKVILLFIHIKFYYKSGKRSDFRGAFILYVLWEFFRFAAVLITFPFIYMCGLNPESIISYGIFWCTLAAIYIVTIFLFKKRKQKLIQGFSRNAQLGIMTCCMVLEFAILEFRSAVYHPEEVLNYKILLVGIAFSCIVAALWILDKREEQKKFQELTSYVHKTREIIPAVGRALEHLTELQEEKESERAEKLLEELQSICQADMQETRSEAANIKTFASTGSLLLDKQLERYLEEACAYGFELDIIVRAPVNELLAGEQINRYQLLQMVGDLYRNACKAVLKRREGGHILICFGYNMEDFYEISVYDNGNPFPAHVLEHLGERGITTDGTGHGMADIFAVLRKGHGSFALEQKMPENSIFTKGIRITFDGKAHVEKRGKGY